MIQIEDYVFRFFNLNLDQVQLIEVIEINAAEELDNFSKMIHLNSSNFYRYGGLTLWHREIIEIQCNGKFQHNTRRANFTETMEFSTP